MKLLLHICCAPCATATIDSWRGEVSELSGTYFNPNIHPFSEHQRRYETLLAWAGQVGLSLVGEPQYDVAAWLRQVAGNDSKGLRCRICITQRLNYTAALAAARGCDAFSTSLLISPWQDHELIREAGEAAAAGAGVRFAYRDLRSEFRRSRELSAAAGLYRQKYCGCIYSEAEAALARAARGR
ncbi:MAG: epoxyqueuosine reductase QueH [Thermoleophilia bacterium]